VIHHSAIAVKDIEKAHRFYTEAMGFELAAVVKRLAPAPAKGWTKHLFYDQGDGTLFALWDLRGLEEAGELDSESWRGGFSKGMGLPYWINHFAFTVSGPEEIEEKKQHWLAYGLNVAEIHHEFIHSIYTRDPDGTLVEWTYYTRALNEADRELALRLLNDDSPATEPDYPVAIHHPPAGSADVDEQVAASY
jgi:catechol 2,3-dioxygenase-like lactoylglutathione lyase family enzyme